VDFWDLTKLIVRRWYVALPTLLVSMAVVFLVGSSVRPDYSAIGYLLMIPPVDVAESPEPGKTPVARPQNPWAKLGPWALGNAAVVKVNQSSLRAELVGRNLSENVTISINEGSAMIVIEVVAQSPAQASGTVKAVVDRLRDTVAGEQEVFGVRPEDRYTTHTISDGSETSIESSKTTRVLIVAGGIGVLLTAAFTIGFDALMRRRRGARGRPGGAPDAGASDRERAGNDGPIPDRAPAKAGPTPAAGQRWQEPVAQRPAAAGQRDSQRAPAVYTVPASDSAETVAPAGERRRPDGVTGLDETIVLPLSFPKRDQDKRNGR